MLQHTDAEVTEIWKSSQMALQMAASVALACAQLGLAWYFNATYSMTIVTIALVVTALPTFPFACHYFIHRARGDDPTLIQTLKALPGAVISTPATATTAVNLLIFSAALAVSPAVQRVTPMPPGEATFAGASAALLLTSALLAAQLLLVQLPLLYNCKRMHLLLALSVDAATHSEGGPAEPLQGVTDAYYAGRATVPPGHTDPEATALWREASTARTMALLPVLACVQMAASALYMYNGAGAFVAIMLATSAVPMFVVTGRYCVLRAAGREPSWEHAKTVCMDTVRSWAASMTTTGTLILYIVYLYIWWQHSDADSPSEAPFLYRGAALLLTFYLLLAVSSVHSCVVLVARKLLRVLSLSHAENRRRTHPEFEGSPGAEHLPAQDRLEEQ